MGEITVLNPEYEEVNQLHVSMASRGNLIEPVTIADWEHRVAWRIFGGSTSCLELFIGKDFPCLR